MRQRQYLNNLHQYVEKVMFLDQRDNTLSTHKWSDLRGEGKYLQIIDGQVITDNNEQEHQQLSAHTTSPCIRCQRSRLKRRQRNTTTRGEDNYRVSFNEIWTRYSYREWGSHGGPSQGALEERQHQRRGVNKGKSDRGLGNSQEQDPYEEEQHDDTKKLGKREWRHLETYRARIRKSKRQSRNTLLFRVSCIIRTGLGLPWVGWTHFYLFINQ